MTEARAPVAVVIVTRNSARFVADCLASLRGLERRPAEIVVVDNDSRDGTPNIVRSHSPEALVLQTGGNLGFCRANNQGIARTSSPFVLVLNPDTKLDRGFLEELLAAFDDPRVGIACGKLLRFDGRTIDSAGQSLGRSRQPVDRGYGTVDRGAFDRDGEVFGACAAAALYRRATIDDVADPGGEFFDPAFFAYYEDLDVAWRARRRGWTAAYRHRAVGRHHRGGSVADPGASRRFRAFLARDPELRFHLVKNRYLAILRNDRPLDFVRDLPFVLARDLATLVVLTATSPGVLGRLWRERAVFRQALRLRRLDAARPGHHVQVGTPGRPGDEGT